ncbi:hypothetical protein D3C86_2161400 [compost metagenome]
MIVSSNGRQFGTFLVGSGEPELKFLHVGIPVAQLFRFVARFGVNNFNRLFLAGFTVGRCLNP